MLAHSRPVPSWYRSFYEKYVADPDLLDAKSQGTDGPPASDEIYHILVTSSHLGAKDPNQQVERLRIVGTYDSVPLARAAGHRALFDAGYEGEFFKAYGVTPAFFEAQKVPAQNQSGLLVHAVAQDETIFQVRLLTTANDAKWTHQFEDGRICRGLYYVVKTTTNYNDGSEGEAKRIYSIEGVFEKYVEARKLALDALLVEADGITRESFAQYEEVAGDERDCGYGENVLVHATGQDGENYSIAVVQGQVLESVRLMEASMRIR
ncbi:hypothetical protein LTS08_000898 [Lithohypha guttulata]|uniref:uncharacterized protein n=1 Tax=Lithohypha guttulata TaxID=1690604 RepID=UPI002DDFC497|nr:hypothetical protein LTR51_006486 [Lithohypha guttulata]KAK5106775.1 hypothetical protein LTS08_000898 [Lithohypha guttulata]